MGFREFVNFNSQSKPSKGTKMSLKFTSLIACLVLATVSDYSLARGKADPTSQSGNPLLDRRNYVVRGTNRTPACGSAINNVNSSTPYCLEAGQIVDLDYIGPRPGGSGGGTGGKRP
jgi:hypothetical protein